MSRIRAAKVLAGVRTTRIRDTCRFALPSPVRSERCEREHVRGVACSQGTRAPKNFVRFEFFLREWLNMDTS